MKLQGAACQALTRNEPGPTPCSQADLKHTGTQLITVNWTVRSLTHPIIDRESRIPPWPSLEGQLRHFSAVSFRFLHSKTPQQSNWIVLQEGCHGAPVSPPWWGPRTKISKELLSRDTIRKHSDPHDIHTQRNLRNQAAGPQFSSKATWKVDYPPPKQSI